MTNDEVRPCDVSDVGRVGELLLEYSREGGKTQLSRWFARSPWHFAPPMYLDESGTAYSFLVNPSGGLVGGDAMSVSVALRPGTRVVVSAPSANRVYRSPVNTATQTVRLEVGRDGVLEWVPEITIPFAGSRFRQTIRARVEHGGLLLLWDAMAAGRIARGERWAFTAFENDIDVQVTGASLVERFRLMNADREDHRPLACDWNYVASFILVGDTVGSEIWKRTEEGMAALCETALPDVLAGVSQPAAPGLVVKVLARRAADLAHTFEALWGIARRELWNLPVPNLRRY
jgi:urease accessory protein